MEVNKLHSQYKHGMGSKRENNPLYKKWSGMKRRCLNKNDKAYPYYGGAGITVCDRWMEFVNFYEDMNKTYFKDASLDRIDNDKGYSKENCRWVNLSMQSRNRKIVTLYTFKGLSLTTGEWDKKLGFKKGTFYSRIKKHKWSIEKAVKTKRYGGIGITRSLLAPR